MFPKILSAKDSLQSSEDTNNIKGLTSLFQGDA
jgi:hypothetical protein